MADETQVIKGIKWSEVFEWTGLFRAFRIAIHPSKLMLGLLALLSIYIGGRVLDSFWSRNASAVPNEVQAYVNWSRNTYASGNDFNDLRKDAREVAQRAYARQLIEYKVAADSDIAKDMASRGASHKELIRAIVDTRDKAVKDASESRDKAREEARKITDDRQKADADKVIEQDFRSRVQSAYTQASQAAEQAGKIKGHGLFITFFDWQINQFEAVIASTINGQFLGANGAIQGIWDFWTVGPAWLLTQHPWFFLIYSVYFLLVWAIFGGAIARIAALHVARDEKPSMASALKFSISKVASFFCAPLIPLLIVAVIGVLISIGGLVGNIPGIGPVIVGALFILALAASFAITLLLLGLIGGFNLMYPAIAVEGTDSFDAITRSFNYVYNRPWRLGLYSLISLVYGSICYLFVRFVLFMVLVVAHAFAGWWLFSHAGSGEPLWTTIWATPQLADLAIKPDFFALGPMQSTGAWLLAFWVYLTIGLLGAFAISFYFSTNTLIYTLLRRNVEHTELDAVYIEQVDEEFSEAAVVTATPVAAPVTESAAAPASEASTPPPADVSPAASPAPESPSEVKKGDPGENPPQQA